MSAILASDSFSIVQLKMQKSLIVTRIFSFLDRLSTKQKSL